MYLLNLLLPRVWPFHNPSQFLKRKKKKKTLKKASKTGICVCVCVSVGTLQLESLYIYF